MISKHAIAYLGLFLCFFANIVMYITFLVAYFDVTKSVVVNVNTLGEANFEFVYIPLTLIMGVYSLIFFKKRETENELGKSSKNIQGMQGTARQS